MSRGKSAPRRIWLPLAVGCWLFILPVARAQTPSPTPPGASPDNPPPLPSRSNANSYAVSLGTGELISVNGDQSGGEVSNESLLEYEDIMRTGHRRQEFKNEFLYALSVASAYSGAYPGTTTPASEFVTITPYLGLLVPTKTGGYIAQYSAVVNPDDSQAPGGGPKAYHSGSLAAEGAFNRRWHWAASADGGYGSELVRAEGPLTFLVIQNTRVVDAATTVRLPATSVFAFGGGAGLSFARGPRDTISVSLNDSYTEFLSSSQSGLGGASSDTLGARAAYQHTVSSRFSWLGYGDWGAILNRAACSAFGGGIGFSAKLNRRLAWEAQGGPEFSTPGCGTPRGGNFSTTITASLNARDRVYASASRVFGPANQVNGVGQESYLAGVLKSVQRFTFAADAGYIQEALIGALPYKGYFVAPRLQIKISNSLGFTAGYRELHGSGGNVAKGNINYAVVSIDWHPPGLRFK